MKLKYWTEFNKYTNSTKQPATSDIEVDCYLKADTDLFHPTFALDGNINNIVYCEYNNRFYFVDSITRGINNITYINCSEDVLATYKNEIGSSTHYILRSASNYNGRLIDNMYPCNSEMTQDYTAVNMGYVTSASGTSSSPTYILGICSDKGVGIGSTVYYLLNEGGIESFKEVLFDTTLYNQLKNDYENPLQFITCCWFCPFNIYDIVRQYSLELKPITIGSTIVRNGTDAGSTTVYGYVLDKASKSVVIKSVNDIAIPKHPQTSSRGKFVNLSPYTNLSLYLDPFGTIQLDTSKYLDDDTLDLQMDIDLITGDCELTIRTASGIKDRLKAQIMTPIQISYTQRMTINGLSSITGDIGTAAVGIATGNVPMAFHGINAGIGDAINSTRPNVHRMGSNGSFIAYNTASQLVGYFYSIVEDNLDHKGRPLCENRRIDTLRGYIVCEDGDTNISCTLQEKNAIESYLTSGFFYE